MFKMLGKDVEDFLKTHIKFLEMKNALCQILKYPGRE